MGVSLHFDIRRDGETKTGYKSKSWYIQEVFLQVEAHDKKKYGGNMHKKWGENPNVITPHTNTKGDNSNSNDAAVLANTNNFNYSSVAGMLLYLVGHTCQDTVWTVAMFRTILHLED